MSEPGGGPQEGLLSHDLLQRYLLINIIMQWIIISQWIIIEVQWIIIIIQGIILVIHWIIIIIQWMVGDSGRGGGW